MKVIGNLCPKRGGGPVQCIEAALLKAGFNRASADLSGCQDLRGCFPGRGFRRAKDGSPKSSPVPVADIRLGDGLLVHWLEDLSPEEISIGMPVPAQFKPKQERRDSILDIRSFKPGAA